MEPCVKCTFEYGGVKYQVNKYPMAGTGAKERLYFDWFYCKHCLCNKYKQLDFSDNTYNQIMFNATPRGES